MEKKAHFALGLIALVLVSFGVARLLTPPEAVADFPDHMMQALEEEWEQSRPTDAAGEITHITFWRQQEGLDLVRFKSQSGGGSAVLQDEAGQADVLAMRGAYVEDDMGGGPVFRPLPGVRNWHIPDLQMVVNSFWGTERFNRVEAVYYVDGQTKRVEYDVPDGATQGMMFVRYEQSAPDSPVVYTYDKHGNQVGHFK